jgi:hypothetical protein
MAQQPFTVRSKERPEFRCYVPGEFRSRLDGPYERRAESPRLCCLLSQQTPVTSMGVSASNAILLRTGMTASNASFEADEKSPAVTVSLTWASRPCEFGIIRAP